MINIDELHDEEIELLTLQRSSYKCGGIQAVIDEVETDCKIILSLDLTDNGFGSVLDVGGGFGFMLSVLGDKFEQLYLLDKDVYEKEKSTKGVNKFEDFGGYNRFSTTEKIVSKKVKFLTPENYKKSDEKFDLIYSWYSCGWHYDPSAYLDWCIEHLNPGGSIVFLLKPHPHGMTSDTTGQSYKESFCNIALQYDVNFEIQTIFPYEEIEQKKGLRGCLGIIKKYK